MYNRKHHYELQGTSQRIHKHKKFDKLVERMKMLEINVNPFREVFNVFNNVIIILNNLSSDSLNYDEIGNELYANFIKERINENLSVWKPMKRCNLKTFGSMRNSFKSVINNKEVHLKDEKNLMTRFLITARNRPQLE